MSHLDVGDGMFGTTLNKIKIIQMYLKLALEMWGWWWFCGIPTSFLGIPRTEN